MIRPRTALLALVLALPALLSGLAGPAILALAAVVLALLALDLLLRETVPPGVAAVTVALLLYATALFPAVATVDGRSLAAFLVSLGALAAWWRRPQPPTGPLAVGAGLLGGLALAWAVAGPPGGPIHAAETLFGSCRGAFYWTPLLWAGLLGYVPLVRARPRHSGALLLGLAAFALSVSAARGPRPPDFQFVAMLPIAGLGLAHFLEGTATAARRHPGRILAGLGSALVLWNFLFMHQYRAGGIPRDDTVSFPRVAETSAALFASAVGAPVAWPANWAFALRHRLPPDRFDVMVGHRLEDGLLDVGDPRSDPLLAEGWSVRHPCGEAVCREVEGRGRLLAPLEGDDAVDLVLRAQGTGRLTLRVNGVPLPSVRLSPGLGELTLRAEAGRLRRGLNEIAFEVEAGGQALVDRLTFRAPRT